MKRYILLFIILYSSITGAQNSVSGSFSPSEKFKFAFIYEVNSNGAKYVDRAQLDNTGAFTIELDSTQAPGLYKVVYAIPPEDNNFDFIYDAKEDVSFTFDLETGIVFSESNENKLWASYLKSMGMVNQTISNYYQTDGKDEVAFNDIFKTVKETQEAYEASAKGMLVKQLILANRPYIPESYEDLSSYSDNLKRTYFDNIDFDNPFLQSSTLIRDRINGYVFGLSENPSTEDYMVRVDAISQVLEDYKPETQLGIYQLLWEEFVELNNDEVSSYIAKQYLLDLAKTSGNEKLVLTIEAQLRTSIGSMAPNFKIENKDLTTELYNLPDTQDYLLVFWSSGCSHCLKELPMVHDLLGESEHIKVIAYGLEDNPAQWEETIKDMSQFVHVYGSKKWDNPIVAQYNLNATPTYFLLDGSKKIIEKPYDYKALEALIKAQ